MARYARDTDARTLRDVLAGADVFLGLSAPRVLKPEWLRAAGAEAADPGARQSGAGDPARAGRGTAAGRDRRHRPQRLSQPGQQRPVLPVHLPRRAGRVGHHDQRGDEDRRGGSDRRARAHGGVRGGRRRLWRCGAGVRPRLHHPQAVRSAPDPGDRPGGGARGDGQRRRAPADPRLRAVSARPGALRVPLRPAHAAGVRGGQAGAAPHRLRRGRGRTGAARGADPGGRRHRAADPARPARGDRAQGPRDGPAHRSGRRRARARPGAGRRRVRPVAARLSAPGRDGAASRPRTPPTV